MAIRPRRGCSRSGRRADRALLWKTGGAGHRVFVVLGVERPPLHARRARRRRVRDGVRRRERKEAAGKCPTGGGSATTGAMARAARRPSDGDRLYAFGGSGDLTALDAATGKRIWSVNVVQTVRRRHAVLGLQRIAAHRRRPHRAQRRRAPRVDCGDRQARWQDAVAEPQRRGRRIRRRCCSGRAACADGVLHRPARARRRSARRAAAVELQPRGEQHREHRDADRAGATACSSRRTTAPARRCSTSRRPATSRRRARCISRARCATITRSSVVVGDTIYGFSSSILTALELRHRRVAWRNRSVGKGSLIYADERLVSLQRGRRRRPGGRRARGLPRARAVLDPDLEQPAHLVPSDHHERETDHPRSGQRLRLQHPPLIVRAERGCSHGFWAASLFAVHVSPVARPQNGASGKARADAAGAAMLC